MLCPDSSFVVLSVQILRVRRMTAISCRMSCTILIVQLVILEACEIVECQVVCRLQTWVFSNQISLTEDVVRHAWDGG